MSVEEQRTPLNSFFLSRKQNTGLSLLAPRRGYVSPKILEKLVLDSPFGMSELQALEKKFARIAHTDADVGVGWAFIRVLCWVARPYESSLPTCSDRFIEAWFLLAALPLEASPLRSML